MGLRAPPRRRGRDRRRPRSRDCHDAAARAGLPHLAARDPGDGGDAPCRWRASPRPADPARAFPADLSITAAAAPALGALARALEPRLKADNPTIAARRRELADRSAARRARAAAQAEKDATAPHITPDWISRCLGAAIAP